MTVSSETARNDYIGTGLLTEYDYTFRILDEADLRLVKRNTSGGETVLVLNTDYTVDGVGDANGGTVTLTTPLEDDYALAIRRYPSLVQETDLRNQAATHNEDLEDAYDRLVHVAQRLQDELSRSMTLPETEAGTAANTTLPSAGLRANKNLVFDASGNPTVSAGASSTIPDVSLIQVVDTLAALKALAAPSAAVTYLTRGYYAAGDGGGGFFRWNSVDASTANNGVIVQLDVGGAGRFNRLYDGALNVRWFGAKGDNATDDTTALQAALTAAIAAGAVLIVPSGTYIASALTINGDLTLTGTGTVKHKASTAGNLFEFSGTSKRWVMQGLTLDGNCANQSALSTNMTVSVTGTGTRASPNTFLAADCRFINNCIGGITIVGGASAATNKQLAVVRNCTFLGGNDGVDVTYAPRYIDIQYCPYVLVEGNHFDYGSTPSGTGPAGVVLYGQTGGSDKGRMTVIGNTFINVGRDATDGLGAIECYSWGSNIVVTGNRIEATRTRGINIKADAENVVITGNTIIGLTGTYLVGAIACAAGVIGTTAVGRFLIANNIIHDCKANGINVDGTAPTGASVGVVISGNILSQIGAGNSSSSVYAINLNNVSDFVVQGNNIRDVNPTSYASGGFGVRCNSCTGCGIINGNLIKNVAGNPIVIVSASAHLTINNNVIDTTTNVASQNSRGIFVSGVASVQIKANTLRDIEAGEAAIYVASAAATSLVEGNTCAGATTVGFSNGGSNTNLRVQGNQFPSSAFHTLTIAAGVITAFHEYHAVDTEGAAATDDLDTISGGQPFQRITLTASNDARSVVLKDGTGNLQLAGDFTLDNSRDSISLIYNGASWLETSRSDNAA
jgi:hypothetical protein